MSDDSDEDVLLGPSNSRRKPRNRALSSDSNSTSSESPILTSKRRSNRRIVSEGSDSDSSGSSIVMRKRKKVARISSNSDDGSDSSGSVIIRRVNRAPNLISDDEEDQGFKGFSSQWETDLSDDEGSSSKMVPKTQSKEKETNFDSDSSDGQCEKCPICLLSMRNQELGSPESCDHLFCAECILEWSKNMNTCPVDRQEYHLILVRKKLNGKIIRQIPVEKPAPPELLSIADQTFCEVCGSGDREDRLLLCDGCDLGFHLECLTPPLQVVPTGSWYCNVCINRSSMERELEYMELHLLDDEQEMFITLNHRRFRLVPRTRQSERVRTQIMHNRSSRDDSNLVFEEPSSSTQNSTTRNIQPKKKRKSKVTKKYANKSRRKYRMVYDIDEETGEIISKRKQVRSRRRKRRKAKNTSRRRQPVPKTVKKRLAQQLGICPMQVPTQSLPDVRIQNNGFNIQNQRYQAGIPTLHLFGQRDDLDYFSPSDEDIGGPNYLVRRAPNQSDVAHFRRAISRKQVLFSPPTTVSSTTDLLGSILDSQSKLYSKSTKFSIDNLGKFKMDNEKKNSKNANLKNFNNLVRKTPYSGNNSNNNSRSNQQPYSNNSSYQGNSSYYYDNYVPSSTSGNYTSFSNSPSNNGGYDQDMPQDYTQSTLSGYDRDVEVDNPPRNEDNSPEDSDIDIYSDIEDSVSTSKVEDETSEKPMNLSPGNVPVSIPGNGSDVDNENLDSDNDMVIDTERVEPIPQETPKEDTAVTSSEDTVVKCNSSADVSSIPHSTSEIQSEAIQSTFEKSGDDIDDDDDAFSEDGCPNFSIYSSESINLAKNTDISMNPDNDERPEQDQADMSDSTAVAEAPEPSEVDESCDREDAYDPEIPYDPEIVYSSEKGSDAPDSDSDSEIEDAYDPERIYETPEDTTEDVPEIPRDTADGAPETPLDTSDNAPETPLDTVDDVPETPLDTTDDAPETPSDSNEGEKKSDTDRAIVSVEFSKKNDVSTVSKGPEPFNKRTQLVFFKIESAKPKKLTLYSDSEDEEVVKVSNAFPMGDIRMMTEDVSEEERSYTPCLDEKSSGEKGKGPDGLDTEMISDDERNDFDESHEQKAASEADALEINAKEFEMDLIRPEDYEEGEIVDKNKENKNKENKNKVDENKKDPESKEVPVPDAPEKEKDKGDNVVKEKEPKDKQQSFKKLSKNTKERNYRDKDRSRSKERKDKENSKSKKRDKRKEIERYDVRALIAEKPRRLKDKFGRDIRKSSSESDSRSRSKSYTPKRSPARKISPKRRSSAASRERKLKKRGRSRRRSASKSRSRSRQRKRSVSKSRRRRSRSKGKSKPPKDRSKRRKRARSTSRTLTPNRKRRNEWKDRYSRERGYSAEGKWTPSLSGTPEIEPPRHGTPSWTPPRAMESAAVDPRNLTVILQNDQNKKKKERKKRGTKKRAEGDKRSRRKRKDRTPVPSKEVFASGDNILVSVSFNKENERRERDVFTKKKKEADDREKKKRSIRRKKKNQELSAIKPVAIIDLERSPFRELTPSPKDVIVLSDDEHVENSNINDTQDICDSSQQVASPENVPVYLTGPKTPPEPQVKFSLPSKQIPLRPLSSNPLHDPEDDIGDDNATDDQDVCDIPDTHKGPNTPPEPPNSPPSSPDAYDPFEPTKSRSPSPDPVEVDAGEEVEKRNTLNEINEKNTTLPSLTPPISDIQPADSQSSLQISRDSSKSPDPLGRSVQTSTSKSTVQLTPFTTTSTSMASTPAPTNSGQSRINILSSTILSNVSSTIPQRIVLPNIKLSPIKISPVKNVIKSTPIKPMPNKSNLSSQQTPNKSKSKNLSQNGNDSSEVISLEFDSPYSPGSSDYEDLFEPPPEVVTKKTLLKSTPAPNKDTLSNKTKNTFDALFGSPMNKIKKINMDKGKSKKSRGTKVIGVKLDEDHLKILDELPNSAVEMQVKDKFLKKLNRQERVVEEVKLVLKPYYNKKKIDKDEYKDIMRRAVPKICHNKSGEINPTRIKNLIEAYVKKMRHSKPKVTSSSSYNPLKS